MKKYVSSLLCLVLMLCMMTGTALAAENAAGTDDAAPALPEAPTPQPVSVYPAEVRVSEENGIYRLEKIYYLTSADDPSAIPTADFDREGRSYTLLDLLKTDLTETDTKEHIEVLTLNTDTKDMAEILKLLASELEVSTEDGYSGVLALDHTSIKVEAAGYKSRSYDVSATRTYPNLSDADTVLIPKSVEENGRTLTLTDIRWESAAEDQMDGYALALRYTAVATYTGTATSKYATGYVVTADYGGEVTRSTCDTVVYTAVFSSIGTALAPDGDSKQPDEADGNLSAGKGTDASGFQWLWLAIPAVLLLLAAGAYFGVKTIKRRNDNKWEDEEE